jgi:hypothetical protein
MNVYERGGTGVLPDNHDDLKVGELPRLEIMAIDDVIFHEEPDIERVAHLVDRFGADGVLKNPPIVAVGDGAERAVLLDGANRVTALRRLDFPHVLVQVIDYDDDGLILDSWHHAVEHLTAAELLAHAATITGVTVRDDAEKPAGIDLLCRLRFPAGDAIRLHGDDDLLARIVQLKAFTDVYRSLTIMDRVSYTNMEHLQRNYRQLTALISFPRLGKKELVAITEAGERLPSGVTRILLPKRALRFNLQLDILRSRLSLAEKNRWLQESIQLRIKDKAIRFYREPTFFFDE